ncbi:MAG: flavin reductase family protein [Candidatus Bipolaricaulota bacterium]|nr:flavin reductase family protein [Candidatus Bipolaricaulota bacterium]MBS3791995.1 flavin reductase family protein [Candidatus Bipolaricaulota bacterium]
MKQVEPRTATGRKHPSRIFQVVTADKDGRPNAMPASWCTFSSAEPIMMAVSVASDRYTHKLMGAADDFVLSFPNKEQKEAVSYCGRNSGKNVDKFEETDLETIPADEVNSPLIEDSVACFECKKSDSIETGDHTLFVGEVVATHVSERFTEKIYTTKGWHEKGAKGFKTIAEINDHEEV